MARLAWAHLKFHVVKLCHNVGKGVVANHGYVYPRAPEPVQRIIVAGRHLVIVLGGGGIGAKLGAFALGAIVHRLPIVRFSLEPTASATTTTRPCFRGFFLPLLSRAHLL